MLQMIAKLCDCGRSSDTSETEMSTHSQQQLQIGTGLHSQAPGVIEACHNNHLAQQRVMDGSCLLTLSRQPVDVRNHESLYAKQLAGVQPSPGKYDFYEYSLEFRDILCILTNEPS